jgi:hypothetical protein
MGALKIEEKFQVCWVGFFDPTHPAIYLFTTAIPGKSTFGKPVSEKEI